jgi:acetolactate synthase-1/3 small subunit
MNEDLHTLTMLVENEPGVTARITSLFAGRGFNIETICGAPTANPKMSRITITTRSTEEQLEALLKQLRRLVNVIKVRVMADEDSVRREMALICVKATSGKREEIRGLVRTFRARIVDTSPGHFIIECTGRREKIEALLGLLEPMGIKKLSRSGILALYREDK